MTEPTELLPCPFCGAAAHFEMDEGRWEWVECESCGMQGNRSASLMEDCKPKLAEEWNRRTPHPDVASGYADGWQDGMSEATRLLTEPEHFNFGTQPTQAQAGAVPLTPETTEAKRPSKRGGYRANAGRKPTPINIEVAMQMRARGDSLDRIRARLRVSKYIVREAIKRETTRLAQAGGAAPGASE